MKKWKDAGAIVFTVALVMMGLFMFAAPSLAAHDIEKDLTIHIGQILKKDYLVKLDSATSKDPSIAGVTMAASGTAASPATRVVYSALKPGTTTVDLPFTHENKKHNVGPIKVHVQDHIWSKDYTVDEEPTCMEPGKKSHHCTNEDCDAIEPGSEVEIVGDHKWSTEYTVDEEATYFEEGSESRHCTVCDAINEDSVTSIPKLKLGKAKIKSVKNNKANTTKITMKMMEGPSGFDFCYGTSKKFVNAKKVYVKNIHVVIKNLKKNRNYYFRARAVLKEDGKVARGKWSATKKLRIKR